MNLGERLKKLRERRGWSQVYVSKKLGLKRSSTYANYEYGIRDPDTDTLARLAEIYETTTDYLLYGSNKSRLSSPPEGENELIIKEVLRHFPNIDLTQPGAKEKLTKIIEIVLDDHDKKQ